LQPNWTQSIPLVRAKSLDTTMLKTLSLSALFFLAMGFMVIAYASLPA